MNVSAISNGTPVTFVDVTVNGLEVYLTYIQSGNLKISKVVRDPRESSLTIGSNAALV